MRSPFGSRSRRACVAGLVLGSITGLLPAWVAGRAPDGAAERLASVMWPGVGASAGIELLSVDITDVTGEDLEGAIVVASLWPSFEARRSMTIGDTFNLTPIDRVEVRGGRATIHEGDPELIRAHVSRNGALKVHLDVYTNESTTTVLMAERVRDRLGRWVDSAAISASKALAATPLRFSLSRGQMLKVVLPDGAITRPLETRHHHGSTCSGMEYAGLANVPETVATAAVYRGIKANVTYTSAAHTRSDLGIQLGNGAWTVNGTENAQSTLTGSYVTVTGSSTAWTNKEYRATWAHHRFWRHCVDPYQTYPIDLNKFITQRFTEPYKVVGFPPVIDSRYPLPGCAARQDLSGVGNIDTESAAATSYIASFTITWGVGSFHGSSQSGYSTAVKIKYSNPTPGTYWYWCGDKFAPQDSYRVRAGR
jgi:hypothetical protein